MRASVLFIFLFAGCTQLQFLPYMDQALTLQDLSAEKERQQKYVSNADVQFDKLWAAAQSKDLDKYKTEKEVVAAFGPPVLQKSLTSDGKNLRQALYRYAIQSKGPHRVYLYYNGDGSVIRYETL